MKLFTTTLTVGLLSLTRFTSTAAAAVSDLVSDVSDMISHEDQEEGAASILFSILKEPRALPACGCKPSGRQNGEAYMSATLIKTLKEKTGVLPTSEMEGRIIQTTLLTSSSTRHVDHYPAGHDGRRDQVTGIVAFIVMNTNEDAYFDHGDTSVPIVEGSLVHFRGGEPHNTVVNSGFVNMIGPFDIMGFKSVGGGGCSNDARCCRSATDCDNTPSLEGCDYGDLYCEPLPSAFDTECECHGDGGSSRRTLENNDSLNLDDSVVNGIKKTRHLKIGKKGKAGETDSDGGSCGASCCSGPGGPCETVLDCCKETCMGSTQSQAWAVICDDLQSVCGCALSAIAT